MTTTRYKHLFSPLRLGPVTVRNRIVFSAHLTNYAQDGLPTAQHAAYYEARARGGAGLIITEEHSTHPTDWPYEKLIHAFDPRVIPGYRRITDAVHRHGVPIFAQLNHNGGQASGMYSRLPVWAPSAVPDPMFREVPKAVTVREIAEIVAGYGRVAGHCRTGGFDGVELQCSHSSIVRGFLSGATNRRTDLYGGPLENRARILLEILAAVREAIGPQMALGVRLCGDEFMEGGITLDQAVEVARMVEADGHADYINTSIGVATSSLYMIEASMAVPPGYAMFIPSALRKAVRLPVVGVGRFKDPLQADRAPPRPARAAPTTYGSACPATRNASAGWASTGGWAASRTRGPAGRPCRCPPRYGGRGGCWWPAADRPACRRPSPPPAWATRCRSTSVPTTPAARWRWPPGSRSGASSATWRATRSPSAVVSASASRPGSRSTWTWCAPSGRTWSWSPPGPGRTHRTGCRPSRPRARRASATCGTC
jgi:2,4-dienoyl-CoA reductase-like NADH-dependent reductase (Old Yellow Enzyme family)